MDANKNRASNISGFYSAVLELNDGECAICYLELREPLLQITCGHRFCRDCMVRYDFKSANCITKKHLKSRRVCCLQSPDSNFSSFPF